MINFVKESKEEDASTANLKWKQGWEQKQGNKGPFWVPESLEKMDQDEQKILKELPEKEKHTESHEGWTYYVTKYNNSFGVMKFPQRKGGVSKPQYVRKMESVMVLKQEGLITLLKHQQPGEIYDNLLIKDDNWIICKYKMVPVDLLIPKPSSSSTEDKASNNNQTNKD